MTGPSTKMKCFGKSAALCFEGVSDAGGRPTVNVELAAMADKKVLWNETKIMFQLSHAELPMITALLLGYLPSVDIVRSEKSLFLERQRPREAGKAGNLFVRANSHAIHHALPVIPGEVFHLAGVCLTQLYAATGWPADVLTAALRGSAALNVSA